MANAKIIQFQCDNGLIYALDDAGVLWANVDIRSAHGWKPVPGPADNTSETDPEDNDVMNGQEREKLFGFLDNISASLAQLVDIQQQRLQLEIKMTIDDSIVQKLLDMGNLLLTKESTDAAAIADKDATIASLNTQLAPNPTLAAAAADFLTNALAANPPAPAPVPAPEPAPAPAPVGAP